MEKATLVSMKLFKGSLIIYRTDATILPLSGAVMWSHRLENEPTKYNKYNTGPTGGLAKF